MKQRFDLGLAAAVVVFGFIFGGCQKTEEPEFRTPLPAVESRAGSRDVASAPLGETNPAGSATGEAKKLRIEDSGEFF